MYVYIYIYVITFIILKVFFLINLKVKRDTFSEKNLIKAGGKIIINSEIMYIFNLRNSLYAGEDATGRTRHGAADRLKIGKGVHQGYILSP